MPYFSIGGALLDICNEPYECGAKERLWPQRDMFNK